MSIAVAEIGTTPWVRRGECNGCGWCCVYIGKRPTMRITGGPEFDRAYVELRGGRLVDPAANRYELPVWLRAPCSAFKPYSLAEPDSPGRCAIYDRRPRVCQDFPWEPAQVQGTPCSYWFERRVDGRLELVAGDGAPTDVLEKGEGRR